MTARFPVRVLITRPEPEAAATAALVSAMGFWPVLCPLTRITLHPERVDDWISRNGLPATLVVTSRNGVRAMAHRADLHALPLWCVGEETTAFALSAGFGRAQYGGADASELLTTLCARPGGSDRALYVSAQQVRTELEREIPTLTRLSAYEVADAEALSHPVTALLQTADIAAVLLYSARAAARFSTLVEASSPAPMDGFFLSDAVYRSSNATLWRNVHIAPQPTERELMHLLRTCYSAAN